jgi:hypothetical protein
MPATASGKRTEQLMTLREEGKPSLKCKVLQTGKTTFGASIYKVQALETGELITVVTNSSGESMPGLQPGTRIQAMSSRIYHWGQERTPPPGTPLLPGDVVAQAPVSIIAPRPAPTIEKPAPTVQAPTTSAVPAPKAVALTSTTPASTMPRSSYGQVAASSSITPTQFQPPKAAAVSNSSASPYAAVPTGSNYAVLNSSKGTKDPTVPFGTQTTYKPAVPVVTEYTPPASNVPTTNATLAAGVATSQAPASDWRQSWGKANDHKSMADSNALAHADAQKPDPLQAPDHYSRAARQDHTPPPTPATPVGSDDKSTKPSSWWIIPNESISKAPKEGAVIQAGPSQSVPLPGMQSVIASGAAASGSGLTVAHPLVTPEMQHPATPPVLQVPQPPQPVPAPYGAAGMANYGAPASRPFGPGMTSADPGTQNAFVAPPSQEQVAMATNAFSSMETAGPSPAAAPGMDRGMMPPTGPSMMVQGYPNGPVGQGMQASLFAVPRTVGSPASVASARSTGGRPSSVQSIQNMLGVLHDSLYPSQREWAVEGLASVDWHANPHVVQALLTAAREDPAPTVRAACVRGLVRMNVNSLTVVNTLQGLRADYDTRVREEAEEALATLSASHSTTSGTPTVLPATVIVPSKQW